MHEKTANILHFIRNYMTKYPNRSPTVREIQKGCKVSSTSVVSHHLGLLKKEGSIEIDPLISRGIRLPPEKKE